jgi:hypothetical protein
MCRDVNPKYINFLRYGWGMKDALKEFRGQTKIEYILGVGVLLGSVGLLYFIFLT